MVRDQSTGLNDFQRLMLNLDAALTGNEPSRIASQYHHYPQTVEKWMAEPGGNPIWYLSDGGYSRVVWGIETETLFLTYNSTSRVVARWEHALPQRIAVLCYLVAEYKRLREMI
jgi:hypothetical protein